jgi:RNA polymerase sigma factor (sigma-70 family)
MLYSPSHLVSNPNWTEDSGRSCPCPANLVLGRATEPTIVVDTEPGSRASDSSDEAWLEDYREILRQAIRKTCPPSYGIDTEDIEQEALLRLLSALRKRRAAAPAAGNEQLAEMENLTGYVYRTGVTSAIDAIRKARRRREEAFDASDPEAPLSRAPSPAPGPSLRAQGHEIARALERALARLSPNRALAVRLHLRGFSTAEIGRLLSWTEAKARNLAYRGLDDLKRQLRTEGYSDELLD